MSANGKTSSAAAVRGIATFVIVVAAALAGRELIAHLLNAGPAAAAVGKREPVKATLRAVEERRFVESARTQGDLVARDYSYVSPRKEGLIMTIPVREGDWVVKDETVLFTMDDVVLNQTLITAKRNLDVAKATLAEKRAGHEKDLADRNKAEKDFERDERLLSGQGISERDFDASRATYDKAVAQMKYAESLVDLAQSQVEIAEASVISAQKDLDDAVVRAPLSAFVTSRDKEPGQNAKPGEAILRLDNPGVLEATGRLAGIHYANITAESERNVVETLAANAPKNGAIPDPAKTLPDAKDIKVSMVRVEVEGAPPVTLPLTYKAPAVDQSLRSFKVKANLRGDGRRFVPGLMANIAVEIRSESGLGVPKTALVERNGAWCVFTVENNKAKRIPVTLGIESDGWVHVASDALQQGTLVIDGGQTLQQIDDGTDVDAAPDAKTAPAAPPADAKAPATPAAPTVPAAPAA